MNRRFWTSYHGFEEEQKKYGRKQRTLSFEEGEPGYPTYGSQHKMMICIKYDSMICHQMLRSKRA
jgi:hypothetical protein